MSTENAPLEGRSVDRGLVRHSRITNQLLPRRHRRTVGSCLPRLGQIEWLLFDRAFHDLFLAAMDSEVVC